jgi:hypothetical protein
MSWTPQVAVIVPCLNEEAAIGKVVTDFRAALPDALIFVYDNGSTDGTAEAARKAGAVVRSEHLRGKGNVVARMFADIEADVYVMVDGDDTYDAASAPGLIQLLLAESLDMVNGAREEKSQAAYRRGHRFGNRLLTGLVAWFFGERLNDMLSGYRIMSRRFVKSLPRARERVRDRNGAHGARSTAAVADRRAHDALSREAPGFVEQAAHHPRRDSHHAIDHSAGPRREAAGILRRGRRIADARVADPRDPGADRVLAHGARPEAADCGSLDRPDAARVSEPHERLDLGDGDSRPRGVEAAAIPIHSDSYPETLTGSRQAPTLRAVPGAE